MMYNILILCRGKIVIVFFFHFAFSFFNFFLYFLVLLLEGFRGNNTESTTW